MAESVMIAGLFCSACDKMAGIFRMIGQADKAAAMVKSKGEMTQAIEKHGWDGEMDYEVELELLIAPRPARLETRA